MERGQRLVLIRIRPWRREELPQYFVVYLSPNAGELSVPAWREGPMIRNKPTRLKTVSPSEGTQALFSVPDSHRFWVQRDRQQSEIRVCVPVTNIADHFPDQLVIVRQQALLNLVPE